MPLYDLDRVQGVHEKGSEKWERSMREALIYVKSRLESPGVGAVSPQKRGMLMAPNGMSFAEVMAWSARHRNK